MLELRLQAIRTGEEALQKLSLLHALREQGTIFLRDLSGFLNNQAFLVYRHERKKSPKFQHWL